jgi:hypothetical protein
VIPSEEVLLYENEEKKLLADPKARNPVSNEMLLSEKPDERVSAPDGGVTNKSLRKSASGRWNSACTG